MNLKDLFSPKTLTEAVRIVINRYPTSVCFLALWTLWMLLEVTDSIDPSTNLKFAFPWACVLGFFLTIAVSIWTEYLDRRSLRKPLLGIACALTVVDFIIILIFGTGSQAGEIGRTALMTGILVSIFFLPITKGLGKEQLTAYTFRQFTVAASSVCLSMIFAVAILIIFGTLEALFGNIDFRIFQALIVIFCGTVQGIFYLRYMPRQSDIVEEQIDSLKMIAICAKNIILPICMIYMAILYVYGFKILFTWSLPKGILTWAVTGLSVVSLIVLYCMQPLQRKGNRISVISRRFIPVLMLPLIMLMSVGLIYRLGEYGPTASRVYVALFAIWAAAIFLWLSVRSSANMNLIAMTFAGTFVTVSIIPGLNVSTLVNKYIRQQIMIALKGNTLPLEVNALKDVIENMPDKEARLTASRIAYLDSWEDHSQVKDIVWSDYKVSEWELYADSAEVEIIDEYVEYDIDNRIIAIPESFNAMQNVNSKYGYDRPRAYDVLQFDSIAVRIPIDSIADHGITEPIVRRINDSTAFVLTKINIYRGDSISVKEAGGVIFSRYQHK